MNYLDLNDIKDLLASLKKVPDIETELNDQFNTIKINNFKLHLSAGRHSFSSPRQDFNSILDYDAIQLCITDHNEAGILSMVKPGKDPRLSYFKWISYFTRDLTSNNITYSYIGSNIPINTTCQIIKDLYKVSQLKTFF